MPVFFTQGRYTREAIVGMVAKPEDRGAAVKKLLEAAGCKLIGSYMTFGEYDFMVVSEGPDLNSITPVLIAAAMGGSVSDLKTTVGVTWPEAMKSFGKAAEVGKGFKSAGKAK